MWQDFRELGRYSPINEIISRRGHRGAEKTEKGNSDLCFSVIDTPRAASLRKEFAT